MLAPSNHLLRAGIGLKLNQLKRATRSYVRDRTDQATGAVTSYAVAAGLFAVGGIFLIAACLVGLIALFRWVEMHYGPFPAFGVVGGLLLLIAAVCAGLAIVKLKRPAPEFPSLGSRLRVALIGGSAQRQMQRLDDRPLSEPTAAAAHAYDEPQSAPDQRGGGIDRNVQAGLVAAALLLGWVALRRREQAQLARRAAA
jgi:Putative Actinobacterial Holin-X, holin superfamily III